MVSLKLSRPPSLMKTALAALIINVLVAGTLAINKTSTGILRLENRCGSQPKNSACRFIQDKFELIANSVIDLRQQFVAEKENNTLSIRSENSHIKKRKVCKVSIDKLINLKKHVNKALTMSSNRSRGEVICDYDLHTINKNETCVALMDFVLCGIDQLNKGYSEMIRERVNSTAFNQWKIAYDELFIGLNKIMDDVKRNITQNYNKKIDILKTNIQSLALKISNLDNHIKDQKLKLIASYLASERLDEALEEFVRIGSDFADIPDIVNLTYTTYTSKNHDLILAKFISKLKTPQHKEIGYRKLLEFMKFFRNTDSYSVVYLHYLVNSLSTEKNLNRSIYESLVKTKDKLTPYVEGVIDGWANELRSDKSNSSLELASDEENFSEVILNHVDTFITKAYNGAAGNAEKILKFTKSLALSANVETVMKLFYLMQEKDHFDSYQFIMVAYRVKQLISKANEMNHAMISDLERIRHAIPITIRLLIWNPNRCTIRHNQLGENLYSPVDEFTYAKTLRRYAFTWVKDYVMNNKFRWDLITDDEGRLFKIRNVAVNEYIYPSEIKNFVFTYMDKDAVKGSWWTLYPYEGKFLLYSDLKKFLYTLGNDDNDFTNGNERRNVYAEDKSSRSILDCHEKHVKGFVDYFGMHSCRKLLRGYFWEIDCKQYTCC